MSLVSIVAVAHIPAYGSPISEVYRVVMVISGSPTSKGTPIGTDLTAKTMAEVMKITLQDTGNLSAMNTKYGMLKLKTQVIAR